MFHAINAKLTKRKWHSCLLIIISENAVFAILGLGKNLLGILSQMVSLIYILIR